MNDPMRWLEPVVVNLQGLLQLHQGWDSYAGRPISPPVAIKALDLLFESLPDDGPAPQLVPMSDGGLQLEWHLRRLNVEVTVPPDGQVEVWWEDLVSGEEREATFDRVSEIGCLSTALVSQGGAS